MSKETRAKMLAEFKRSLPEILEGRDPHRPLRVNCYRLYLGLPPLDTYAD
jgi:hypothetical protein